MVAFAAQVAGLNDEPALDFPLQIAAPLLNNRIRIVVEKTVTDTEAQLGIIAAGGAVLVSQRQVVTTGERIAQSGRDGLEPVGREDHVGRALEPFRSAAARRACRLEHRA